jgi:hypothetical protein
MVLRRRVPLEPKLESFIFLSGFLEVDRVGFAAQYLHRAVRGPAILEAQAGLRG